MKRKIPTSAPSLLGMRLPRSVIPQFARPFSTAGIRLGFPLPPLGRLGDPHLLDRLHAPLRRYRD